MNCLCCNERVIPEISWQNVFFFMTPAPVCPACKHMLYMLKGKRCTVCSREYEERVCPDCRKWETFYRKDDPLTYNYSIYAYNPKIREILARWKYRGDYQLGGMFKEPFRGSFRNRFPSEAMIVPIPLSHERMMERAFNQAQMLASFLSTEIHPILARIHGEKQSKKTRKERLGTTNPFKLTKTIHKPVILVDDLYTTGITLRHAAVLLRDNGCPEVYAYTLIRA